MGLASIPERISAVLKPSKHVVADVAKRWTDGIADSDMTESAVEKSGHLGNLKRRKLEYHTRQRITFRSEVLYGKNKKNIERVNRVHLATAKVVTIKSTKNIADAQDYMVARRVF